MSQSVQNCAVLESMEQKGLRLFGDVFIELMNDNKFNCLNDADNGQDNVSLNGIALNRGKYKNIDEFLSDIDLLVQRCTVDTENYMVAQAFKKECQGYANAIKTCPNCYESRLNCESQPNFFENVCTKPHLIVMAKFDGFPLWPAKLISFNDARRIATVQCFGDHEEADVTFDQCFLFSYEIRRRKDTKQISKLAKGDKEVGRHIQNIVRKFGSFNPAPSIIAISDVEQHLIDMFPGVYTTAGTATTDEHQPAASLNESHDAHNGNSGGNGGSGNNKKRKLLEEFGAISVKIAAHEKKIQNLKVQQGRIARILEN